MDSSSDIQNSSEDEEEIPLTIDAVSRNNLQDLHELIVQTGAKIINTKYKDRDPLLHFTIAANKPSFFQYLISFPETDLNILNDAGQTPLIAALHKNKPHFALKLIEKGADIDFKDTLNSCSALHYAIYNRSSRSCEILRVLLEKGADVNAYSQTPADTVLKTACLFGLDSEVYMCLYYGALVDLDTLAAALTAKPESRDLHEVLFNHAIDPQETVSVDLHVLMSVLVENSPHFPRFLRQVSKIIYEPTMFPYITRIASSNLTFFKMLIDKFQNEFRVIIANTEVLSVALFETCNGRTEIHDFLKFLQMILESDLAFDFVHSFNQEHANVGQIVYLASSMKCSEEDLIAIICGLLSYGLDLKYDDLECVYKHYGFSDLFEILLHMDFETPRLNSIIFPSYVDSNLKLLIPLAIVSVNFNLEKIWTESNIVFTDLESGLDYFNDPSLKDLCVKWTNDLFAAKARNMGNLPSLLELSRNATRTFITRRYNIKNCRQFYTVLKTLPIAQQHADIIAYKTKIYH